MTSNRKKMAYAASQIANDPETQQELPRVRLRARVRLQGSAARRSLGIGRPAEFVMNLASPSHVEARHKRGLRPGRTVPGGRCGCSAHCSQHRLSS